MASKDVTDAVSARISANWTRTPVKEQNVDAGIPKDLSAFLKVEYWIAKENQASLGGPGERLFRETGAIRFVLFVPNGSALSTYLGYIDELRDLFRATTFGGVNTWGADPAILNDQSDRPGYFELAFAVAYYFDTIH